MGRSYAGVLGLTAFTTVVVRAIGQQSGASATFPIAAVMLFVFAGLGYLLGTIAQHAIASDLKARFAEEMSRLQTTAAKESAK
jgi:hypothetical protein